MRNRNGERLLNDWTRHRNSKNSLLNVGRSRNHWTCNNRSRNHRALNHWSLNPLLDDRAGNRWTWNHRAGDHLSRNNWTGNKNGNCYLVRAWIRVRAGLWYSNGDSDGLGNWDAYLTRGTWNGDPEWNRNVASLDNRSDYRYGDTHRNRIFPRYLHRIPSLDWKTLWGRNSDDFNDFKRYWKRLCNRVRSRHRHRHRHGNCNTD